LLAAEKAVNAALLQFVKEEEAEEQNHDALSGKPWLEGTFQNSHCCSLFS
jgi:hypothetical protein